MMDSDGKKLSPSEAAYKLLQSIGVTTLFDEQCNGGYTLPLHVSKKIALIVVDSHAYSENDSPFPTMESWIADSNYWNSVRKAIETFNVKSPVSAV